MINSLAICLVLSSLSTSGFWSPSPEKHQKEGQDVIAGNGHRVVVVEYGEQPQHSTRVSTSDLHGSISASDKEQRLYSSNYLQTMKNGVEGADNGIHGLKEIICDALGKCKHKISTAVGKAKEISSEKVDQAKEVGFEKAKETTGKVKDKVSEKPNDWKDGVKETAEKGREIMKEAKDIGKTIKHDMATNVSETVETAEEEANVRGKETTKTIKHVVERVKDESHRATNALLRGGRKC